MGFFSRFTKKKKIEIVSLEEALSLLNQKIESKDRGFTKDSVPIITQIQEYSSLLKENFLKLEKKEVPKELPRNSAGIIRKLKNVLIRKVVLELDNLNDLPHNRTYFDRFIEVKNIVIKWSVKNRAGITIVDEVIAKEIARIFNEFERIEKDVNGLLEMYDTKKLHDSARDIRNALDSTQNNITQKKAREQKEKELKIKIESIEDELTKLKEGSELKEYYKEKEELEKSKEELDLIKSSLNTDFSVMSRALRKFGKVCIDEKASKYAENPVSELLIEGKEYPELKKILKKLIPMIESGELNLKDRVREKAVSKMQLIISGSLAEKISKAQVLIEHSNIKPKSIILDNIASKEREFNKLHEEIMDLKNQKEVKEVDRDTIQSNLQSMGFQIMLKK